MTTKIISQLSANKIQCSKISVDFICSHNLLIANQCEWEFPRNFVNGNYHLFCNGCDFFDPWLMKYQTECYVFLPLEFMLKCCIFDIRIGVPWIYQLPACLRLDRPHRSNIKKFKILTNMCTKAIDERCRTCHTLHYYNLW